tara:strand:+ start:191 stop:415 length:225 start_codon:yes stop_codon:yes gene_type:complete
MLTLKKRTERDWLGNGMGYSEAEYEVVNKPHIRVSSRGGKDWYAYDEINKAYLVKPWNRSLAEVKNLLDKKLDN